MQLADLPDAASKLLADFTTELTALGVALPDAIYRAPGILAWDGPSLTVYMGPITQGMPGVTQIPPAGSFKVMLYVQILRTTAALSDDGDRFVLPDPSDVDSSGADSFGDAAALLMAAQAIHAQYLDSSPGETWIIDSVQPLGPEGGLAAVRVGFEVALS